MKEHRGSNRIMAQVKGDNDIPVITASIVDNEKRNNTVKESVASMLDSKAFFSRQAHKTLLSSMEFHSGIKEIQ